MNDPLNREDPHVVVVGQNGQPLAAGEKKDDESEERPITEMVEKTGWQQHSVRGALAGSLKKRGLTITSEKIDGVRRYRAAVPA